MIFVPEILVARLDATPVPYSIYHQDRDTKCSQTSTYGATADNNDKCPLLATTGRRLEMHATAASLTRRLSRGPLQNPPLPVCLAPD